MYWLKDEDEIEFSVLWNRTLGTGGSCLSCNSISMSTVNISRPTDGAACRNHPRRLFKPCVSFSYYLKFDSKQNTSTLHQLYQKP